MSNLISLTISTTISLPSAKVWDFFTDPKHNIHWNFAHESWHCPSATADLRVGGSFTSRMEAKDGSFGFDFGGVYTVFDKPNKLAYTMGDDRTVEVIFAEKDGKTAVSSTFQAETENDPEMQRNGWQAILDNFKKYADSVG